MLTSFDKEFPPNTEMTDNNKQPDMVIQQGNILIIFILEETGQCELALRQSTDTLLQQIDNILKKKVSICYSCHRLLSITATDVPSMLLFLC